MVMLQLPTTWIVAVLLPFYIDQAYCDGTLSQCSPGSILENGKCYKCDDYLNYCNKCENLNKCIECNENYFLLSNNQCGKCQEHQFFEHETCHDCDDFLDYCYKCKNWYECTECHKNYYYHSNKQCGKCVENCEHCEQFHERTVCLTCTDGYYKDDFGLCTKCPDRCEKCTGTSTCTECKHPYRLYNYQCYKCSDNCSECMKDYTCVECAPGFTGLSHECKYMYSCPGNCKDEKCDSDGYCYTCKIGYYGTLCTHPCLSHCGNQGCERLTGMCNQVNNTTENPNHQNFTSIPRVNTTLAGDYTGVMTGDNFGLPVGLVIGLVTAVIVVLALTITFFLKRRRRNEDHLLEMRDEIVAERNIESFHGYDQIDDIARTQKIYVNRKREMSHANKVDAPDAHVYDDCDHETIPETVPEHYSIANNEYLSLEGDSAGLASHEDKGASATPGQGYYSYAKFTGLKMENRNENEGEKTEYEMLGPRGENKTNYAALENLPEKVQINETSDLNDQSKSKIDINIENNQSADYLTPVSLHEAQDPNRTMKPVDFTELGSREDENKSTE